MKKRICFVDDDPRSLESLQKELAGVGNVWECVYASSGPEVLSAIASQPFDVVVADMDMPKMNGAELLRRVGEVSPKTLRFVLGEIAQQELVVSCIGGTHQFIARPCTAREVMASVNRSLALDAWLSSDRLRLLVPRLAWISTERN